MVDSIGTSDTGGIEVALRFGATVGGPRPVDGQAFGARLAWAGVGDRRCVALSAEATAARRIAASWARVVRTEAGVVRTEAGVVRAEAGVIGGLAGQDVSILDRAFLGGDAGPRGFAPGAVGPRDRFGDIDSALGGTRYGTFSPEVRRDVSERIAVGAFVDAGATWDLGAPQTGASGPIGDGAYARTSAGLAPDWTTPVGQVSLILAQPVRMRDGDVFDDVSLGLSGSI